MAPSKPASPDEIALYTYLGEALCQTQHLEQALNHCITMKMHPEVTRQEADERLSKLSLYTLGKAIRLSATENLFTGSLQKELNEFLVQRNWLVHHVMMESNEDMDARMIKHELLRKIKAVTIAAGILQRSIEMDMIEFCEGNGKDMGRVRASIKMADEDHLK